LPENDAVPDRHANEIIRSVDQVISHRSAAG
jgi:hypothetical protein